MSQFFIVLTHMTVPIRFSAPLMVNFLQESSFWEGAYCCHGVKYLTGQQYARKQKEAGIQRGKHAIPKEKLFV